MVEKGRVARAKGQGKKRRWHTGSLRFRLGPLVALKQGLPGLFFQPKKQGRPEAASSDLEGSPGRRSFEYQLNNQPKFTPSSYWYMEISGAWSPVNAPGPDTVSSGAYMPQKVSS